MSANPSRWDKWPLPSRWRHVWVRPKSTPTPAPYPGLVLWWRHKGSVEMGTRRHIALVVFVEEDYFDHGQMSRHPRVRLEWVDSRFLRPVASDYNQLWPQGRDGYR